MECKKLIDLFTITFLMLLFLVFHCSALRTGERESRSDKEEAITVAVLDFEQEGFINSGGLHQFAADELTTLLFLKKKARVVDRSQVTATLVDRKLSSKVLDVN